LILCLSVACLGFGAKDPARNEFLQFMKKYHKTYASSEEFDLRFHNFKASLTRVEQKNAKSNGGADGSLVYGITKFSDMSPEEFKNTILMKNPIVVDKTKGRDPSRVLKPTVDSVPDTFDWREKGAVTPVKDQEQCGSCWAFSATENIESMWILSGQGTNTTVDLSPQQIVDCDQSDGGCDGGDPTTAYDYVISAPGLETEKAYPYAGEDENCTFNSKYVGANITTWNWATELYDEGEVQANLVSWGPLSVCVDATAWQDYQSGVMTWTECAWINLLDHCVQLVGYNATAPTPYWIVRNSWNTDWGVEGYIYLEMWRDTCGIAHEATCSVAASKQQ